MDACLGHILEITLGIEMKTVYKNHNPTLYIDWAISP